MSETSSDKSPLERFLEQYWKDREVGVQRSLDEYVEMFPGDVEALATEFLGLRRAHDVDSTTPVADRKDPATVERLGPYVLEEELGRGAQGVVYKATNTRTGGRVAVKVLRGVGPGAEELLLRFKREAQAAAKADHPGVCAVYDAEIDSGVPYIAMRYVEGQTLAKRIARTRDEAETKDELSTVVQLEEVDFDDEPDTEPDSVSTSSGPQTRSDIMRAVHLVEKAARALHAVHEAGVIHRDVKPGNIMITPEGEAVIMDFGLARDEESDLQTLTRSGDLFGTPAYMSPEQLTRQAISLDRRTDVWSLGVVLYECITLRRPFEAPSREGLYRQILAKDPVEARRISPTLPPDVGTIIAAALEKDCDRRYQTALGLADDLRRVQRREPIVARPVSAWTRSIRWAQRNPTVAASIAAIWLVVIAGFSVSLWFAGQARTEAAATLKALDLEKQTAAKLRLRRFMLRANANAIQMQGALSHSCVEAAQHEYKLRSLVGRMPRLPERADLSGKVPQLNQWAQPEEWLSWLEEADKLFDALLMWEPRYSMWENMPLFSPKLLEDALATGPGILADLDVAGLDDEGLRMFAELLRAGIEAGSSEALAAEWKSYLLKNDKLRRVVDEHGRFSSEIRHVFSRLHNAPVAIASVKDAADDLVRVLVALSGADKSETPPTESTAELVAYTKTLLNRLPGLLREY